MERVTASLSPMIDGFIKEIGELKDLTPLEQANKLKEILAKTPIWAYGILGSALLVKVYLDKRWSYWTKQGVDGPKPTIGKFGNGTDYMDIQRGTLTPQEWVKKYGKVSGGYFGLQPFMVISDVDIVKEITIKQFSRFQRREAASPLNHVIGKLSKHWMTFVDGDKWKRIRHSTTPMMSQAKLEHTLPLIENAAKVLVKDFIKPGEEYDSKDISSAYTIKAIMSSGFSINPEDKAAIDEAERHALQVIPAGSSLLTFLIYGLIPESIRFALNVTVYASETDRYFRGLVGYLSSEFKRRSQNGEKNNFDFASLMMANEITEEKALSATKGFTHEEILANAMLFILAGHETTASTLQFFWYYACMNPTIQDRIYSEIKQKGNFNYEDIRDFKYLDACIKETMRIFPPAPVLTRYCSEDTTIGENIHVEKGTSVMWFNTYFHMHPDLYDNPTKFDPSRWEGNESNTLQDDHWFGFGHGPRACPGTRWAFLTMKMIMIEMIRTYEIVPCDRTPKTIKATLKDLKMSADKPMILSFKRRSE